MDNEANTSPLPQQVAEEGIMVLNFPNAIQEVINGKRINRLEWNNKEEYGVLKDSWLMIYRNGKFYQWTVSDGDMLAEDWITI